MKILEIGPSETGSCGGMAEVIRGIRESRILNKEFTIDSFPSYIDGKLPVRLLYSCVGYLRFLRCCKQYDLFHIHTAEKGSTFRKNLYLRKIKKEGKKAVVHIHGAEYLVFYDGLNKHQKQVVDDFFRQADLVLALSEQWKRELDDRLPIADCRVLNNGVDTDLFQTAIADTEECSNSFLMLGRLGARKGVYDLIEAVETGIKKNPKLNVCIAGDGEVEKVRELVAKKGLEKHILVPGWIDETAKLKYLKKVSTLILPSYHEGLPVAVLEGMAAGKAIISTAVGAIPEVVGTENGILVSPGDVAALAEAMLCCSSDTKMLEGMSRANRKKAENLYSIRRMHKQLAEYYRQVSGREGESPVKKEVNTQYASGKTDDQRNRSGI